MNLIDSYDNSDEIVKASILTKGQKRLHKIAIAYFKKELTDILENREDVKEYSEIYVCGEKIKIYEMNIFGINVILYKTLIGGPAAVSMMEELHARGVEKFIIFGSCGELTNDLKKGSFMIPTEALRDEGTSYHYLPASEFVNVKSAELLEEIFKKNNINYELVKVWTTDALYMETKNKMLNRIKSGCKVVDMECASIMAFAEKRNIEIYQFLYTDDTLASENWDMRTLIEDRSTILDKCLEISSLIVKEIS